VRTKRKVQRKEPIKFPNLTLLSSGPRASNKQGNATLKPRVIDPLKWGPATGLSAVFDEHPDEFVFLGASPEWSDYQPTNSGEAELVIGLDFGTTLTKVVIAELGSGRSWVVPLSSNKRNPYLLRSEVYFGDDHYNLAQNGQAIAGLKMPLLIGPADQDDINGVTAFLALVIRYVQLWMLNEQGGYLRGMEPIWFVNVGLPAKDFQDNRLIRRYRAISWAAMSLASEGHDVLSAKQVEQAYLEAEKRRNSHSAKLRGSTGVEVYLDQVGVFPEIMAQMAGFVRSRHWDVNKPEFMLVDVGGGTLDQTIFNVVKDKNTGDITFAVLRTSVEKMGTLRLHDARIKWLLMKLRDDSSAIGLVRELQNLLECVADAWFVPNQIQDYLVNASFGNQTIDDAYSSKVLGDLLQRLRDVLMNINPGFQNTKRNYPVVLAGGGASNPVFHRMTEPKRVLMDIKTQPLVLPMPENLIAPGLDQALYHRVSVAYGLAQGDLGKLLTPDRIKDLHVADTRRGTAGSMISKEMT